MNKFDNFKTFVESFAEHGDRLAIQAQRFIKTEQVTYARLQQRSYQSANFLLGRGIGPKDRVMIIANNSPEWVQLYLGAQLIGAIVVTVDAKSSLEVAAGFIRQTGPKLVFHSGYVLPELSDDPPVCIIDDLNELIATVPATPPNISVTADNDSTIVFTSGTTASPKGVLLTQRNILTNVSDAVADIPITNRWRLLSVLPLSHMYELTGGCLTVLAAGASVHYLERLTPRTIADALKSQHITTMLAIPELLSLFLDRIWQTADEKGQLKLLRGGLAIAQGLPFALRRLLFYPIHRQLGGKLKLVITGGAPIPPDISRTWEKFGIRTLEGYGLTETSPILTLNPLSANRLGTQGRPLPSVQLRISKTSGEVQATGPSVFSGYWNNPDATRAAFSSDGWFKSGDIGKLDEGYLKIQGRLKFAIVLSSGLKVFPEDVELVTAKIPDLKDCCIVGADTPRGEEVMAVVISDKTDRTISAAIARVNDELQPFQAIRSWRRWPETDFPRTRLLKVDRNRVQKWANGPAATGSEDHVARSLDQLKSLIGAVVSTPPNQVRENSRLADVGLDSLRRLTLVSLIEEKLGVSIPEELISQKTTLADLRQLIKAGNAADRKPISPHWTYWRPVRWAGNALRDSLIRGILRIWVKLTIDSRSNLSDLREPALIIFNHTDNFDGPVVFRSLPRSIRRRLAVAVAADVMAEHKGLAFTAKLFYGGFRFSRHEPYGPSLEFVGSMIASGWNILISPEGHLSSDGTLKPFKSGIGVLAVELDAPVVIVKTVGLYGTVPLHKVWPRRRSRVTVRISHPIRFNKHRDYEAVTKELHDLMAGL